MSSTSHEHPHSPVALPADLVTAPDGAEPVASDGELILDSQLDEILVSHSDLGIETRTKEEEAEPSTEKVEAEPSANEVEAEPSAEEDAEPSAEDEVIEAAVDLLDERAMVLPATSPESGGEVSEVAPRDADVVGLV